MRIHGEMPVTAESRRRIGLRFLFGGIACLLLSTGTPPDCSGMSQERQSEVSLEDYGLEPGSATRWELPRRLREISGLATTSDHRLLAHNDEAGVVFEIDYRDGSIVKEFQLSDMTDPVADDFEGIAVADGRIYLVTSSGRLYEFPEGAAGESVLFRVYATGIGRECEIEGLAYDSDRRELLLMCKDARSESLAGRLAIYRWSIDEERLSADSPTIVPIRDFARRIESNRYHPSGIERHPVSGNYFVIAARQGAIAEVTPAGEVLSAKRFTAGWHRQVEGVAFAEDGSLIVADEGGGDRAGLTVYPGPASDTAIGARQQDTVPAARFIFVGDIGTGNERAWGVAAQIHRQAEAVPVSHVFLLGDNVYEFDGIQSLTDRVLDVYRDVSSLGVTIHAALGNHDVDHCTESGLRPVPRDVSAYRPSPGCSVVSQLGMPEMGYLDGFRYYSIEIPSEEPPLVEVFVLDSNTLGVRDTKLAHGSDEPQLRWLAEALRQSSARWKVVAMHHPIYTPIRCHWFRFLCRGADAALTTELESIFREHGVDAVFQGHQHLYARLRPQHGIRYFVTGAGGRRADAFRKDERTVPREDKGAFNHFVYVRATEDQFGYCVVDAEGNLRDGGSFARGDATDSHVDPCSYGTPDSSGRWATRPSLRDRNTGPK